MASKHCLRSLQRPASPLYRPHSRTHLPSAPSVSAPSRPSSTRTFTSTSSTYLPRDGVINTSDRPRWDHTPPNMQAPLSVRERKDPRFSWTVNTDPTKLDRMYVRLLGRGGDAMLTEEVKWLCVTHKSFDHGRRGFNDRLAFLGRRIVMLHASLALVNAQNRTRAASKARRGEDTTDPFAHPALEGLQGLTSETLLDLVHKRRIAPIASRGGLGEVMRWLPMRPDNLGGSGIESVLSEALFAIVGAVALQRGGEEAARITRERILGQLGIV